MTDGEDLSDPPANDAMGPSSEPNVLPPPPPRPEGTHRDAPPSARWGELLAVFAVVAVADIAVYRGGGYAGWAAMLAAAIPLLWLAKPRSVGTPTSAAGDETTPLADGSLTVGGARTATRILTAALLLLVAAKLLWLGTPEAVAAGLLLVTAWSLAAVGRKPFMLDTVFHAMLAPISGLAGLVAFRGLARRETSEGGSFATRRIEPLSVVLPVVVIAVFAVMFVKANPALSNWVSWSIDLISTRLGDWLTDVLPGPVEILFWAAVFLLTVGLVRPLERRSPLDGLSELEHAASPAAPAESPVFAAFRNTLACVVGLFAVYLVFEFATLWRRDFPEGFYYAGYAHAGAAWLTVALATATLLLSLMFRGTTLADPRLPTLRRLAWVWSAENLLLAAAVINRLLIYVDFNGMTRMRVIGFLGVLAVVGGLVLVVVKIARSRGFVWLVRRDLWVLSAAVLLYVVLPVDRLVHAYNTRQVLSGNLPPSVQIAHHPVDAGGMLSIIPLLEGEDPIIRAGVLTMLRREWVRLGERSADWSHSQLADSSLRDALADIPAVTNADPGYDPSAAWERFRDYTYQWY